MEIEGVVHDGVVVPDNGVSLEEGTRVRIIVEAAGQPQTFGRRFAEFRGVLNNLPADLAAQHDHYRLGTPKR